MNLSSEEKLSIIEKYKTGNYNCSQLAREVGRAVSTIISLLRKENLISGRLRKYTMDEHYFDIIDTQEKAYFLGLLYADGCVCSTHKTIIISLQERDKEILDKFNLALNTTKPLKYISNLNKKDGYNRVPQYCLVINSAVMHSALIKLGCIPRKSLILKFPTEDQVPKHLLRHWLRGVWDGDGSLAWWGVPVKSSKTGKAKEHIALCVSIVGTDNMCHGIKELIFNEIKVKSKIEIIKNKEVKRLKIRDGREGIYKFIMWLYQESTIF